MENLSLSSKKISAFQLYAILFVCRATALFTFIAPQKVPFEPGDRILMVIPFLLIEALFTITIFLVTGENKTLLTRCSDISVNLKKIVGVVYALAFAWSAGVSLARFEIFVSTVMFPGDILLPFAFLLVIACVYMSRKGIETIGRSSVAVLTVMLLTIIAIVLSTREDFDILNLSPPLTKGILPPVINGFSASARTPELGVLLFILPQVRGNAKKGVFLWLGLFGLLASVLLGAIAGVTGKYGDSQMFQLYTLTVLAKFGVFEKADALISGLWVICSLFRGAFFIMLSSETANKALFKNDKNLTYIISGAAVFLFYFLLSSSVGDFSKYLSSQVNKILYTVLIGVVPLIIFVISKISEKTRNKRRVLT